MIYNAVVMATLVVPPSTHQGQCTIWMHRLRMYEPSVKTKHDLWVVVMVAGGEAKGGEGGARRLNTAADCERAQSECERAGVGGRAGLG